MHVENETADRRRGQSAIIHQLRPISVAALPRVEPKGLQQIQGMPRAQAALGKRKPQRLGFIGRRSAPGERIVEIVEKLELRLGREGRMIGYVIGRPPEAIEGENGSSALLAQQPRGDRKILVPMTLAGKGLTHRRHARPVSRIGAWIRPFQYPPPPRQYCSAESKVKPTKAAATAGRARPPTRGRR